MFDTPEICLRSSIYNTIKLFHSIYISILVVNLFCFYNHGRSKAVIPLLWHVSRFVITQHVSILFCLVVFPALLAKPKKTTDLPPKRPTTHGIRPGDPTAGSAYHFLPECLVLWVGWFPGSVSFPSVCRATGDCGSGIWVTQSPWGHAPSFLILPGDAMWWMVRHSNRPAPPTGRGPGGTAVEWLVDAWGDGQHLLRTMGQSGRWEHRRKDASPPCTLNY